MDLLETHLLVVIYLLLLCYVVLLLQWLEPKYPGEATVKDKFNAFYAYLSSKISYLKTWCKEVPGRVSEVITRVITYIQQTEAYNQVVGGFNLSVYLLTGIPLDIFSHLFVGTREALYASIEELRRVYEAGQDNRLPEVVRSAHVASANRLAEEIMAQIQAAELEAEQEEVGGEKTGGARKSKSRRRRGPTVNKKQKKSRRYKRSNNRGGSRKSKKATKKRRN